MAAPVTSASADATQTPQSAPEAAPKKKGRTNTPWTAEEEQRLKTMRDAGRSWSEIAKTFPTRTEGSVKKHWYKDMHYAEFAEEESVALREAIKEYEANKWKVIGQKVGKPAKVSYLFPQLAWCSTPKSLRINRHASNMRRSISRIFDCDMTFNDVTIFMQGNDATPYILNSELLGGHRAHDTVTRFRNGTGSWSSSFFIYPVYVLSFRWVSFRPCSSTVTICP
jgi:hypothetical protein